MSVKASELPELVAAAVRKAVEEQKVTDATLQGLPHRPIIIGLIAQPELSRTLAAVEPEPQPWRTIGIRIQNLKDLASLTGIEHVNEGGETEK